MIWRRYYGPDPNASQYYSLPQRSLTETVFRPWITRQTVMTLRRWSETIVLARQPWAEKGQEWPRWLRGCGRRSCRSGVRHNSSS